MDDLGLLCCDGQIYVPNARDLQVRVLRATHDHPTAGHFGQNKKKDRLAFKYKSRLYYFCLNKLVQKFSILDGLAILLMRHCIQILDLYLYAKGH